MHPHRERERRSHADEIAFTAFTGRACAPLGEGLQSLTEAFRRIDRQAIDETLDELSLPLFGMAQGRGLDRAEALHALTSSFIADERSMDGLWIDVVLRGRRGHPVVLGAVAVELGRRAGCDVGLFSTPERWYAGTAGDDNTWLVELGAGVEGGPPRGPIRRHCAHEVAFAVLAGLEERFERAGCTECTALAARLRGRLPLKPPSAPAGASLRDPLWQS